MDVDMNAVAQLMGVTDERAARVEAVKAEWWPKIEWHCRRHGVLRDVPNKQVDAVEEMLVWFMGRRCSWWTKSSKGTRSVEFVPMTKVFPPPSKPWGWCGSTVLWGDWQQREADRKEAVRSFTVGERVSFVWKGVTKRGVVVRASGKTVGVHVEGEGNWRMTPDRVERIS